MEKQETSNKPKKRSQIRIEKEAAALQRNLVKRKKQVAERARLKAEKQKESN